MWQGIFVYSKVITYEKLKINCVYIYPLYVTKLACYKFLEQAVPSYYDDSIFSVSDNQKSKSENTP